MTKKDIDIVTITITDGKDDSPVEMVSHKWMRRQRKINAAGMAVAKRWRALKAAILRLEEAMRD